MFIYILLYIYIIYIIIIYIVICPKNGTIFTLRVPGMGLLFFGSGFLYFVYVYMGNVESTPVGYKDIFNVICIDMEYYIWLSVCKKCAILLWLLQYKLVFW